MITAPPFECDHGTPKVYKAPIKVINRHGLITHKMVWILQIGFQVVGFDKWDEAIDAALEFAKRHG